MRKWDRRGAGRGGIYATALQHFPPLLLSEFRAARTLFSFFAALGGAAKRAMTAYTAHTPESGARPPGAPSAPSGRRGFELLVEAFRSEAEKNFTSSLAEKNFGDMWRLTGTFERRFTT